MNSSIVLSIAAIYSEDRINGSKVSRDCFVTTDSMVQNKGGVTITPVLPKGNLIAFSKGDILVGNIRPYLKKIWYADKNGGCSPDVLVIKAKSSIDSKFLYYSLFRDDFFNHMMNGSKGTKMPRGDKSQILRFHIPKMELSTQRKIASILSSLDSKIELNNRINSELEAMAKTLYDYWFVQFDFPDKNGKPYKTSGGKMVWNEELKREIPQGWKIQKIISIIDVKDGTHDSPKPQNEGYRLITSKNLQVFGLDFENANFISEKDFYSIIKRSNVETGDILFSMIGNIGTIYKIEETEINFAIKNVALFKTSQRKEYKNYVYMFLKSIDMHRYMKNVISGSIQKFIGLNTLRDTPIFLNDLLIEKYNDFTFSIFEKLEKIKLENQKLTELRDWLLPMLMNGQVKVIDEEETELSMAAEPQMQYGK
jgi:type I restriction enzyme S subunit